MLNVEFSAQATIHALPQQQVSGLASDSTQACMKNVSVHAQEHHVAALHARHCCWHKGRIALPRDENQGLSMTGEKLMSCIQSCSVGSKRASGASPALVERPLILASSSGAAI
eukprot:4983758-Pleurochrysis_carterae.AAC.2